ncbi:MAG TPA: anti-sigma factor [Kofleriaceae bacterium]|nr:anti-sigma factor [Kofleriaceae bacterium]
MTTCKTVQPRLTAYLDGELADEHGSVVRGHLRECEACRQIARDEAALRDGLRGLAPIDPPASLWAGVQARLAAAEVADARKPRWRRTLARWARWPRVARWMPATPQLAAGGLIAALAVGMVYWRAHRVDEPAPAPVAIAPAPRPAPPPPSAPRHDAPVPAADDVTADLMAEPARTTASYGQVIEELMTLASTARAGWSDEQRAAFDGQVAALRGGISRATQPRVQQRAQRALIRYLQGALVRDDVALASGGAR